MEVFIKENKNSITVGFKHGSQTFQVDRFAKENSVRANWLKTMLTKCFTKFEIDILTDCNKDSEKITDRIKKLKNNY